MPNLLAVLGHIVLGCITIILTLLGVGLMALAVRTWREYHQDYPEAILHMALGVIFLCAATAVGIYNVTR